MEAEYDAIYLMLEQFYAISDRLKQCNGQWAEARGPVFRAPTPENIRAFLQVDSELIKLYKELCEEMKNRLGDLCIEIDPSEDAQQRQRLRTRVFKCNACGGLVAFMDELKTLGNDYVSDDEDDNSEEGNKDLAVEGDDDERNEENDSDDNLDGEDYPSTDEDEEQDATDPDPTDPTEPNDEPTDPTHAIFNKLITNETGMGRHCKCDPRQPITKDGETSYYVPLVELFYCDGLDIMPARKAF